MARNSGPERDAAGAARGAPPPGVTRRSFISTLGASAAVASLSNAAESAPAPADRGPEIIGPGPVTIRLTINGRAAEWRVDPATTLLDALRLDEGLTGTKEICDRGACGGCSVLVDGLLVNACMMLALDAEATEVTTVEGLAANGELDPVQESFVRHDGLQCGYCTPGLVMACRALLNRDPRPSLGAIKRGLSGNICRCGAYTNVFNAALEASGQPPIRDQGGA